MGEDHPVTGRLGTGETVRGDRAGESASDGERVVGGAGIQHARRRRGMQKRRLRRWSSLSQGCGEKHSEEREKYCEAKHDLV
jgi:hypothetical protein